MAIWKDADVEPPEASPHEGLQLTGASGRVQEWITMIILIEL